jgi:hypothetical protein
VNELAAPLAASPPSATSLKKKADVVALLSRLKHRYADRIAGERVVPASDGCYADFPSDLDPRLAQALTWISSASHLVSFNGKCFDVPLLITRYRLARMANPFAD